MRESVLEPGPTVIDYEALKARCLGSLDLMERVLNKFTNQLDVDLEALEAALTAGDTEAFALVAHRIKGMSANVGAGSLHVSATAAERAAREKGNDLATQIERIQHDRDCVATALSTRATRH